jgi:hypothetical protein
MAAGLLHGGDVVTDGDGGGEDCNEVFLERFSPSFYSLMEVGFAPRESPALYLWPLKVLTSCSNLDDIYSYELHIPSLWLLSS